MTTVIEAPQRMGARASAQRLLAQVPADLGGQTVEVNCEGSWPTTSFVDELIVEIIERRGAAALVFRDGGEALCELVAYCASDRGLLDRVACSVGER